MDRESGALFLGGGVGIAAAPKGVLCRKRQRTATPIQGKGSAKGEGADGPFVSTAPPRLFLLPQR